MNENIKKFLEKLAQDEQLYAKFETCKTPEEAYAVASSTVGGFTKEEFIAVMTELNAANNDLNDDDLKKFAGGIDWSLASILSATSASCLAAAI